MDAHPQASAAIWRDVGQQTLSQMYGDLASAAPTDSLVVGGVPTTMQKYFEQKRSALAASGDAALLVSDVWERSGFNPSSLSGANWRSLLGQATLSLVTLNCDSIKGKINLRDAGAFFTTEYFESYLYKIANRIPININDHNAWQTVQNVMRDPDVKGSYSDYVDQCVTGTSSIADEPPDTSERLFPPSLGNPSDPE